MSNAGNTERGGRFDTTRWTVVCTAQEATQTARARALEALCGTYWYPLYAYVRRRGHRAAEAEDLTQEFFRRLIEKDFLKAADRDKGRFRTFLLVAMKRFLANEWHRAHAQKRGGHCQFIPIDTGWAEEQYHHEPVDHITPESLFERRWANLIIQQALDAVRTDLERSGKGPLYQALKDSLIGVPTERTYAEIGASFGMTEEAIKVTVHRMRKRYRKHFRAVIADTVESEAEVDAEIDYLRSVLAR